MAKRGQPGPRARAGGYLPAGASCSDTQLGEPSFRRRPESSSSAPPPLASRLFLVSHTGEGRYSGRSVTNEHDTATVKRGQPGPRARAGDYLPAAASCSDTHPGEPSFRRMPESSSSVPPPLASRLFLVSHTGEGRYPVRSVANEHDTAMAKRGQPGPRARAGDYLPAAANCSKTWAAL